jgi:hypothetical protein
MKPGLEGRLIKLEREYETALDSQRSISIRWLTADKIKRGWRPGLYELPPEDGHSPVIPAPLIPEDVAESGTSPSGDG